MHHRGLRFDIQVASGGYAWWYIDALSDDGRHGLTLIAFVGSVFSPYYAWARRRGPVDPLNHCAFNIALYEARGGRWAMTERGRARVHREPTAIAIGPSSMCWTGNELQVSIDEVGAPLPRRVRGLVRLIPTALCTHSFALDAGGLHVWTPFAPCARVEVQLSQPCLNWSGEAYFDSNSGDAPLEDGFGSWTWSRARSSRGTVVHYDTQIRSAEARSLAMNFSPDGAVQHIEPLPLARLPHTGWRVARSTRADVGFEARVVTTFEDAPFYSRSLLDTQILGERTLAMHESLSLDRFRSRWVQCLLPFRMPRIAS